MLYIALKLYLPLGTINQRLDDYCYYVEDSVGNLEKIYREDILADSDDTDIYIQVGNI